MSSDPMREESKARRASNREGSAAMLRGAGIAFESKNGGAHLIVKHEGRTFDFWPGTGKWKERAQGSQYQRGVRGLISAIRGRRAADQPREPMIPRFKRTTFQPDEYTYDIVYVDRLTGREVFSYDGADPANTNSAYGAPTDKECFERRGLDIDAEIPLSKSVLPVEPSEAAHWQEIKKARQRREREDRAARDLYDVLGEAAWKDFSFERYIEGERKLLTPALEALGYRNVTFYMQEQDSFGPLVRGCVATDSNSKRVRFFYG